MRITVSSQKSSIAASTLSERCEECNGLYGHHGTCSRINQAAVVPSAIDYIFGSGFAESEEVTIQ